jgi:ATP-dependent DNA helicase RecG
MDITQLKGIGAKTAANLNRLSVYTVEDLVRLYPRDYIVYEEPVFINSLADCEKPVAAIEATVIASPKIYGNELYHPYLFQRLQDPYHQDQDSCPSLSPCHQ